MSRGWIRLYRELIGKAIWQKSTPEQRCVLIAVLCLANHSENEWEWNGRKFKAEPGQFVSSMEKVAKASGSYISRQNVRSALARFKKLDFLTYESTKTGILVTVTNWASYQCISEALNQEVNQNPTNGQPTPNQGATTNKNDNNDENVEKGKKERSSSRFSLEDHTLAQEIFQKLLVLNPQHREPNFDGWANDIRLMREQDGRSLGEIKELFTWANSEPFWKKNILSPAKLRHQWDKLVIQRNADREKPQARPGVTTLKPNEIVPYYERKGGIQ